MKQAVVVVWFKRDLRIHDHAPLFEASCSGFPVLPIYICEPDYWTLSISSRRHWHFINDCLQDLRAALAGIGQPLIVRTGEVREVLSDLLSHFDIRRIYAHEETGNAWTFERDLKVIEWCKVNKIDLLEYPSNGVVRRLKNRDEWAKIRNRRLSEPVVPSPSSLPYVHDIDLGIIPDKDDPIFGDPVPGIVQTGGRTEARNTLKSFLYKRGQQYLYRLSAPGASEQHCSRLSAHIAYGTLSIREIHKALQKRKNELNDDDVKVWRRNLSAFGSRLAWHCHFIQKLEDQPSLETRCMHPAFEGMREPYHNIDYLKAWSEGNTGYPLIDACMRNLNHEGWITFRMRAMLVSFASYHLWLDWRKTGYHLAQVFTDYEPGIHYSQLQMQSGVTGINTLRIYNPIKQSQEHDPDGTYIRKWVPELKNVTNQWIHEPWKMDKALQKNFKCMIGYDYPEPLVDHKAAVKTARNRISEVRKQEGFQDISKKVYEKLGSRKSRARTMRNKAKDEGQLAFDL